eukprot:CAMPEP_0201551996 /NCGR_PEP_ID=MMETSP0173_2-20130828/12181_1 /ASSEMBLY_ACC=CAM_ASM_000268 /TAXON_ID=218659 /ORGANISM="Vexillifera sp., Strain DIVA3 564/2" /LENGTH=502 /DNA_ID=CAMNT_0047962377 /DNA_START=152 /DNA_END=1660 /DNA_ORIENTATION=+
MLVSGGGDIKLTKDGNVLLQEMQIQSPTAALIARVATAQDKITGDGTTSNVLLIAELMKQSERYLEEGVHPSILAEGFELAKRRALEFLERFKHADETLSTSAQTSATAGQRYTVKMDNELLMNVAKTSLFTKLRPDLAEQLTKIVVESVQIVRQPGKPIDLFMVEQMMMLSKSDTETRLVSGLVLDHGFRHPDMPKAVKNCYVLTCNVSLEYEKTEVNSGFYYKDAKQRQQFVDDERKFIDERCRALIEFRDRVIGDDKDKQFVVVNQKGIDIMSLDILAKAGIPAVRRAKRRNMERMTLACGGIAVNSFEDLKPEVLGYCDRVWEETLGEDKYTFFDGVKSPFSCTILIKGPHKHVVQQIKDAVRDGLRAVKNAIEDRSVVPGAGAFEIGAHNDLMVFKNTVKGRKKLGVQAFADALLIIPKTLASNSGYDVTDTILQLTEDQQAGHLVGLDLETGETLEPDADGIWDNYRVKRQLLHSMADISSQLLLIDEIIKAGKKQ